MDLVAAARAKEKLARATVGMRSNVEHCVYVVKRLSIPMKPLIAIALVSLNTSVAACEREQIESFSDFFGRYSQNKSFSVNRTVYPLPVIRYEDEVDENGNANRSVETSYISRTSDLTAPSLSQYLQQNEMRVLRKKVKSNSAFVEVGRKNADWLLLYNFVLRGKCWYLTNIENPSL